MVISISTGFLFHRELILIYYHFKSLAFLEIKDYVNHWIQHKIIFK